MPGDRGGARRKTTQKGSSHAQCECTTREGHTGQRPTAPKGEAAPPWRQQPRSASSAGRTDAPACPAGAAQNSPTLTTAQDLLCVVLTRHVNAKCGRYFSQQWKNLPFITNSLCHQNFLFHTLKKGVYPGQGCTEPSPPPRHCPAEPVQGPQRCPQRAPQNWWPPRSQAAHQGACGPMGLPGLTSAPLTSTGQANHPGATMKPTGPAARAFCFVPRGPPSSPPSDQDRPDHPLTEEVVQESCRKALWHTWVTS